MSTEDMYIYWAGLKERRPESLSSSTREKGPDPGPPPPDQSVSLGFSDPDELSDDPPLKVIIHDYQATCGHSPGPGASKGAPKKWT